MKKKAYVKQLRNMEDVILRLYRENVIVSYKGGLLYRCWFWHWDCSVQIAAMYRCKHCVGIELCKNRHDIGFNCLNTLPFCGMYIYSWNPTISILFEQAILHYE